MSTGDSLLTPISKDMRNVIIDKLWGSRNATVNLQKDDLDWDPYFSYYSEECTQASAIGNGQYLSAKSHDDITTIAKQIEDLKTYGDITKALRPKLDPNLTPDQKEDKLKGSIRLAARLLVMVDIGPLPDNAYSGRSPLVWDQGTLKDCIQGYFTSPQRDSKKLKLEPLFTARNLVRITGIEIEWTDNLADHLRLIDGDQRVCIFHHASFLKWQQSQILPKGLAEETLNSLALLFPQSDKKTRDWFYSTRSSVSTDAQLDSQLVKCGQLRTERRHFGEFKFWHDRLVILKRAFDESYPATFSQWWHDRRNGVQWYTFWVAIVVLVLTVFFGMVQSIEGAIQVYKAYHPS